MWIACCAAAMVMQAGWKTGTQPQYHLAIFVAAAALCSYNFHYLLAAMHDRFTGSLGVLSERPAAVLLMLAGGAAVCWLAPGTGIPLPFLIVAAVLNLLYSLPLLPFKFLRFTRRFGVLKTLLLAFTWTYVTGFLPLYAAGAASEAKVAWFLLFRFCYMLILCLLFDNRDIAVDLVRGFSSLATHLTPRAVRFMVALLLTGMLISSWQMLDTGSPQAMIIPFTAGILLNAVIYFLSLKKQGYFFYYFVVDGSMVFTALITWLTWYFSTH